MYYLAFTCTVEPETSTVSKGLHDLLGARWSGEPPRGKYYGEKQTYAP